MYGSYAESLPPGAKTEYRGTRLSASAIPLFTIAYLLFAKTQRRICV